jgi:hypothetical protein
VSECPDVDFWLPCMTLIGAGLWFMVFVAHALPSFLSFVHQI